MTAKSAFTIILFVVLSRTGIAQRMESAGSGSIGLSYTALPTQSFKDTSGGFGYQAWGINLNIPFFSNRHSIVKNVLDGQKPHFYQVSGHAGFESLRSSIGFINSDRNIYQVTAGLGGLFYNGRKNIILADVSTGIASDGLAIQSHDTRYRFSGLFLVNHLHSTSVMYQYGLVFTYAYGRPLPLPVLGIRKKFAQTWSLSAILPVSVQLTDKLNKQMSISFLLRPSGNRFQLENQNNFHTASPTVYMQLRQFELGMNYQYRFAKQFSLGAEAGLLAGGKLKFTEVDDFKTILYQTHMKPGARFRLSLRYLLPHKANSTSDMDPDLLRLN